MLDESMGRTVRLALLGSVLVVVALAGTACSFMSVRSIYMAFTLPTAAVDARGLRAQFFGTTTILVSDGKTSIMVDGFFSRPGLIKLLLGKIEPDENRINTALCRGHVEKVDGLLVAHSHHDHAMDSAAVAKKTGALLVGSESTANIARGEGLGKERIRVVKECDSLTFGKFKVTFFESPHSPNPIFAGTIDEPLDTPAKLSDYKLGKNYNFLLRHPEGSILIVPGANFTPGLLRGVKADVIFLSIGTLGKQSDDFIRTYWREVVQTTGAKLVIPIHWDDFTRSLDEPLKPLPFFMDNMEYAMKMLQQLAQADGVAIRFMPLFDTIILPEERGHDRQ